MPRLLVTCFPGYGHLQPLLPLAAAYRARGWDVAIATGPDLCGRVEQHGFVAVATGLTLAETERRYLERYPGADELPVPERLRSVGPRMFVDISGRERARDLVPLVRVSEPDLIVHDVMEVAAPLAAELAGVPRITHGVSLMNPSPEQMAAVGPAIDELYADWGVPDGAELVLAGTYLDLCPPSLQLGPPNPFARVQPIRPTQPPATSTEALPQLDRLPYDRTVHLTLGTVVNDAPGVFETVVAALREEQYNLVVTVGPGRDPRELGTQPAHVVVETYLPHADLLPRVDLVVSHAGAGTLLATVAHGLPSVLLPFGAEQHVNAMLAAGAGIAEVPDSPEGVADAVRRLLDDTAAGERCRTIAAEIAAMPTADEVLDLVGLVRR